MIKAVFFDFGGVLLQYADGVDHKGIEAEHGLPERTLLECVYIESRYTDLQIGACADEEWGSSVIEALAKRMDIEKAKTVWRAFEAAPRDLNPDMIDLVKRLRESDYKVGIVSNTTPGMTARLDDRWPGFSPIFHDIVGSGDVKMAKPDPAIWHYAMERLGVQAEESVFADDMRSYAAASRDIGMHGFHFTGYEQFVDDLRSVGVNVSSD
jgi:epoxide hydrolase-like predicted phosphatase